MINGYLFCTNGINKINYYAYHFIIMKIMENKIFKNNKHRSF